MKFLTKEVQIGLVAIVGIVALFFGLKFLKGLTVFSTDENYYVKFHDISGLSVSSPVYANGFRVGVVEDIVYNYDGQDAIVAVLGLDKKLNVPKGTTAEIASDLLGNVKLELSFGNNPLDLLAPGDTLYGGKQQGIMSKAGDMVPQIQQMLPKLDSILASVNALLADPALGASLQNINQITTNLSATTNELKHLSASLDQQVPGVLQKADGVMANAQTLTQGLNELDLALTMSKVNQTLQNVEQMTAALNSKDGTLGLLMRDQDLYRNLSSTMNHADSLMMDLKSHPKRYVHFSIFGRKDK